MKSWKKISIFCFVLMILAINIFFAWPRLSQYSSVDEPYWTYDRTPDFWRAISERRWNRTDINDKPGVTVAILSGIGLPFVENPLDYKSLRQEPKTPEQVQNIININFFLRLPIYLTTLLFLLAFYFLLKKLFNRFIALTGLIFIGLSPVILGISLIINPDSLLWGFLPLSILSYLVYQKTSRRKYLIFTGILLGLSLLTKYVANILYVYLLGLLFLEYIFNSAKYKSFLKYFKKAAFDYLIIIALSCLTFFLLYPACWEDSEVFLEGTLLSPAFKSTWPIFLGFIVLVLVDFILLKSRIFSWIFNFLAKHKRIIQIFFSLIMLLGIAFVFYNIYSGMNIFDFEGEMASPKGENTLTFAHVSKIMSTDLYGLVFGLTPLALIFFIWAVGKNILPKKEPGAESNTVLYFSIFILLYYLASTISQVTATVRYQIVIYPLAAIVAAIGLWQFFQIKIIKKILKEYLFYVLVIVFSAVTLFSIRPHFFNYSSSFLPNNYILNLKDMGDGSFEAAQFLNQLPEAQNMTVWSDKGAVCETFWGKCNVGFHKNDTWDFDFDYFVLSTGRKSRSLKLELSADFFPPIDFPAAYADDFSSSEMETLFNKNPRNFVRVIKKENIIEIEKLKKK